ncbi:hypothetical protein [Thalassotalea agariperforans]
MMMPLSSSFKRSQQGIALIQVLLISAIISILAIQFSYTAREQLIMAETLELRVKANQIIKSVQSKVFYTLFTQNDFTQKINAFPNSEPWNFYGKPFVVEQTDKFKVKLIIQDNSALLPQQYMNLPLWTKAFVAMGLTEQEAKQKQGKINDWQDQDDDSWMIGSTELTSLENGQPYRNQPIQLIQEIEWFFSEEKSILNLIKAISSHYTVTRFNPMNAPEPLLVLILEQEIANEIIKIRDKNELTTEVMTTLLGDFFESDTMVLHRGNSLRITIQVAIEEVQLQETLEIKLQQKRSRPMLILSRYN